MLTGRYIFIDIGTGETKIIEALVQRRNITLLNSSEMRDMSLFVSEDGVIKQIEGFCESLKNTLTEAGITAKKAVVCSSVFSLLTKDITAEYSSIKACVSSFKKDYFKLSGHSVVHDWHHMGDILIDDVVQQKLYLTSGPADILKNFVREMRRVAGITVVSIESPLTARSNLRNVYTATYDLPCVGLVDVGRDVAHCEIFKNEAIIHVEEIQSALFQVSETLADKLSTPLPKINNILYNIGLVKSGMNDSILAAEGISPMEYYSTLEDLCRGFVTELQLRLSEIAISKNLENVQIIFMGGYMAMPGVAEFIQKLYTFTPSRIFTVGTAISLKDTCITSNLSRKLSAKYATCIGLTLKNCNDSVHMVNLLPQNRNVEQIDWGTLGIRLFPIAKWAIPLAIVVSGLCMSLVVVADRANQPMRNEETHTLNENALNYFVQSDITTEYGAADISIAPIIFDEVDEVNYKYVSLNESVATISNTGMLSATGVGSTLVAIHADIVHNDREDSFDCAIPVNVKKGTPSISANDIFVHLTEEEYYIDAVTKSDSNITYTAPNTSIIEVVGNKVYPKCVGTTYVIASVEETDNYLAGSRTIAVTVMQDSIGESVKIVDFSCLDEPQFDTDIPLRMTIAGSSYHEVPFIVYCDSDNTNVMLYQDTVRVIPDSATSVDFDVNLGSRTGDIVLRAVILDSSDNNLEQSIVELPLTIQAPSISVNIIDKPASIQPGDTVTVDYKLSSDTKKDISTVIQLKLDGTILTTERVNFYGTSSSLTGSLTGTIPTTLSEGTHSVTVTISPSLGGDVFANLTDTVYVNYIATPLGLEINGTAVWDGSSILLKSEIQDIILKTTDPNDIITTVTYANKQTKVYNNSMSLGCRLSKSQRSELTVTVATHTGAFYKTYNLIVVNPNDDDGITFSFVDSDGKNCAVKFVDGEYYISLPVDSIGGQLFAKTNDTRAKISYINNKAINSNELMQPIVLSPSSDVDLKFTVVAEDNTTSAIYSVHVSNRNVKPKVAVSNNDVVNNRVYGLVGSRTGQLFSKYDEDKAGIVLEVDVSDTNYNQFLSGRLTYSGKTYPICWNTLAGPKIIPAGKDIHGYIFIPCSDLKVSSDITRYTIEVMDSADYTGNSVLSITRAFVQFGVNVKPSDFTISYDTENKLLSVDTEDSLATFSYTVSAGDGTIRSGKFKGHSVSVALAKGDHCQVTMIDSMGHEVIKKV